MFSDLNLVLPGNKTIAFVGESGSGKSTLFSLLLRYYELKNGTIKLGEASINEMPLNDWRNLIALVPQDSPLISGSIRENLTLGLQKIPSDLIIEEALQKAQLLDFISQQEKGLDTQVGERGVKLSGGQKQRLAIARAILQDSPILLCDEATSNLDSATEFKIQQAMEKLTQNRTTLIAAHRLSTVMGADKIVVMKSGAILGQGTHTELLATLPYYQELVELQLKTTSTLEEHSPKAEQLNKQLSTV
ncbi:MAG: ATP-binding cassette domain-containing protein [Kangiellaceae bacterium]|nr:ATP-binding cassette domain-containing protein [Kangiellaceae bacterium]